MVPFNQATSTSPSRSGFSPVPPLPATSSLCDLTTRRIKMRGVSFVKSLFGRPKFKPSGRISIRLSRLPRNDVSVFAESIPFVAERGLPPPSPHRTPRLAQRSKSRRLKKGSARPNPRRRSWSLLKKFNIRQSEHDPTPPKTLKRHASMYSISPPLDFRHITHYSAGNEMPLLSSSLTTLELYEPGRQPVRKETSAPIKKTTSLARISTDSPSSMTLCEAANISSQWLNQEESKTSSQTSKTTLTSPDSRAPSRLGPLPDYETRPNTSRSRRTKASSRPSTAGSVSSTLYEVEMGPPGLKFEEIVITPPKRKPAPPIAEVRPPSRRGPVQEIRPLTARSTSSTTLREAATTMPWVERGEAKVSPPKRKPVPAAPVTDLIEKTPSRTGLEFLDQESRPTSPMAKRKPVPYHILDEISFSDIPSAWAQAQRKITQ